MSNTAEQLAPPVADEAPVSLRKLTLRRVEYDTPQEELARGFIAGVDAPELAELPENDGRPFWEPGTAVDADRLYCEIQMREQDAAMREAHFAAIRKREAGRAAAFMARYWQLFAAAAPVLDGGTRKAWHAPSGNTYTHQPSRSPQYKLTDKDAARKAHLLRMVEQEETTGAINAWREAHDGATPPGFAVTLPCPVSFSPPKEGR